MDKKITTKSQAGKLAKLETYAGTAEYLATASLSENTRRMYASALGQLVASVGNLDDLNDKALALYLSSLFDAGKSPAVGAMVVAAVRCYFKLAGKRSPVSSASASVLAGFKRKGADRGRGQATGVTWGQVDLAVALAAREDTTSGDRDAALLALGSDCLLRISEIAAVRVDDLEFNGDGPGTLTVRRSKTDQTAKGVALPFSAATGDRLQVWLAASGIASGFVFRSARKIYATLDDHSPALVPDQVRRVIQKRCRLAGITGQVSGHSLRVGAAQTLADAGLSLVDMQTAGRWSSPVMPAHYARGQLAGDTALAKLQRRRRQTTPTGKNKAASQPDLVTPASKQTADKTDWPTVAAVAEFHNPHTGQTITGEQIQANLDNHQRQAADQTEQATLAPPATN